jgi:UDP-N-acetylmuramoyl-tripeptide--D-alanyl-D-alanine ligase
MAELGDEEEAGHRTVGHATAGMVDILVVVGAKARWIGEAAKEADEASEVIFTDSNVEAVELLRDLIGKGDYVLVKGARIAATEEIVVALSAARAD